MSPSHDFGAGALSVVFTNEATGRRTVMPNVGTLPALAVVLAFPLVPEQVYRVEVVGKAVRPVPFFPFVYSTSAENYVASTGSAKGAYVKFMKVHEADGDILSTTEQWLSI